MEVLRQLRGIITIPRLSQSHRLTPPGQPENQLLGRDQQAIDAASQVMAEAGSE
jgi:hypothetical protein